MPPRSARSRSGRAQQRLLAVPPPHLAGVALESRAGPYLPVQVGLRMRDSVRAALRASLPLGVAPA
eukprot:8859003-Alexandrium_andersonii.AAC.1